MRRVAPEAGTSPQRRSAISATARRLRPTPDPAQGRADRPDHHGRVSRPSGDRPAEAARPLRHLQADKPPVLVSRDLRLEVAERLRHDGTVEIALDEEAVRAGGAPPARGRRQGRRDLVSCTASCGLSTRARAPRHRAEEYPEAFVCASHEVAPEFREYERHLDRGGECLSRPGHEALYRSPCAAPVRARHVGHAASDAVERRRHRLRGGGRHAGAHRAVRPVHRRGRARRRSAAWPALPDLITFDMGGTSHRRRAAEGRRGEARLAKRSCTATRSRRRCSTSTPSVPAAARLPMSTVAGCSRWDRAAPAPIPVRSVTAGATPSRPSPTPMSCCRR